MSLLIPALLALAALPQEERKPIGTVVLDISETVGEKDGPNRATHFLRKYFRRAGYRVVSFRKTALDEKGDEVVDLKGDREKAKKAKIAELSASFVVQGSVRARFDRTATFYGHVISHVYKGSAEIEVLDGKGRRLKKIPNDDEAGGDTKEEGQAEILRRLALYTSADVLRVPAVRKTIPKEKLKELKTLFEEADAERKEEE